MTSSAAAGAAHPPGRSPLVRVVVVTYFPGDTLSGFLASLRTATTAAYEVVLADNGSTDGAPEAAAAGDPAVRLVRTGGNIGYGRAANVGADAARTPWLLVANPDITFTSGALDRMLAAAEAWPRGGAFGPAIRTADGSLYPSARSLPSLRRGVGHALAGWWWPGNPWTAAYRRERGRPVEGPVGWLSGSCLLLRRAAWESVGGFDPAYFMYFEDTDLGDRLGRRGWQSVYVPSAVVTHAGGHATARARDPMVRAHHVSAYRYLARRYPGGRWAALRAALAGGLAGRYALSRAFPGVGEGAAPTRPATLLDPAPPANPAPRVDAIPIRSEG
ncbi:MAG TPA: glycosyltransferase family 2 protein [Mycobacteriales bacterium]|nr:glycosyltransferase family 2 protein [Mycobacteriales bacterium]